MKLKAEKDNKLLGRKSYTYEIEHSGKSTPKKADIKEEIAKKAGVDASRVTIRHIFTGYGANTSKVIAHVYEDEKVMTLLEPPKGKKPAAGAAKK